MGVSKSGEALASKSVVKQSTHRESFSSISNNDYNISPHSKWSDLQVTINIEEIKQNLLLTDQDLREVGSWIGELNKALTDALISSGFNHLMGNVEDVDQALTFISYFLFSLNVVIGHVPFVHTLKEVAFPYLLLINFLTAGFLWHFFSSIRDLGISIESGSKFDHRLSTFIGYELDRLAILWLMSNFSDIIKPLPEEK